MDIVALDPQAIWYGIDGKSHGPVDLETIRRLLAEGTLRSSDFLWDHERQEWIQIHRFPSLLQADRVEPPMQEELEPVAPAPAAEGSQSPWPTPYREPSEFNYAGFTVRGVAWFLDILVLVIPAWIWIFIVESRTGVAFDRFAEEFMSGQALSDEARRFQLMLEAGMLVLRWIYEASLESSVWQATVGKRVMGLVVTDEDGVRLSFMRATARHFSKILSQLPLFAGYLLVFFTARRQALHDKVARTLVIRRRS